MDVAIVIPAYNEAATIVEVVHRACRYGDRVIVVDDGSSDGTGRRLAPFPITLLRHRRNQGKAAALRRGMDYALVQGARLVITLDGDGQHRPEDIPRLLAASRRYPGRLIIGARLRRRRHAPRLRRLANRMADFWISWAAGYPIRDSQSGFRLYPAELLGRLEEVAHDPARGFVFESELLIEAARRGCYPVSIPIDSLYHPGARASHYRPWRDTLGIIRMVAGKLLSRGLYLPGLGRYLSVLFYRKINLAAEREADCDWNEEKGMKIKLGLVLALAVLTLVGCRTAPIYEVSQAPVVVPGRNYNLTDVRNAILQAGASLGWQMRPVQAGHIIGTLNIRSHMAQVDIFYDRSRYDIKYKDSSNLNYDGSKIHSNYNGWVQRLDNTIRAQLAAL